MAAALLICLGVGGCLDDSLAPTSNTARLDVRRVLAQVNAGEKATVVVEVGYLTYVEEVRALPVTPSRIAIDAGATVSVPIAVTLDPCLADPDAYHGGSEGEGEGETGEEVGCLLEVTFTLLDQADSEISSTSTVVDFLVTPGQTVELENVVLSNVWSVEVAPIDTLTPEQVVTAVATARTKSGNVVQNATFNWYSYDTTVATIDPVTGVIETRSPGTTYIQAESNGVYGGTNAVVMDFSFDERTPDRLCVTIDGRTICPEDSREAPAAPVGGGRP